MNYKIKTILEELQIKNYTLIGNPKAEFSKPSTIWDTQKDSIAFCVNDKIQNLPETVQNTKASVVILPKDVDLKIKKNDERAFVLVNDPKKIFIKIANWCFPTNKKKREIHQSSMINADATIDSSVYIGPHCVIGKCNIDKGTIIYANVIINDGVVIGKNVIIYPNCAIGFDGFGHYKGEDGAFHNFPHYGNAIIGDDVEIFPFTNIDRGTLGNTVIGKGTKIDHHCHIGHNVKIGEKCIITAGVIIAGSATIGDNVWIGINSSIRDGVKIGNEVFIGMGSVVVKDVPKGIVVYGNPAKLHMPKKPKK